MRRNLVLLLVGALAGGALTTVFPAGAHDRGTGSNRTSADTDDVSVAEANDNPPRPFMRSHGVRIRAARIGFCPREQVEANDCAFPDIFMPTRPLPVHPRGHVFVNTRVNSEKLDVSLFCGSARPVWQLGPRRWVFHISHRQGTRKNCDGGQMHITYAEDTEFAGGVARFTFSTRPHRH